MLLSKSHNATHLPFFSRVFFMQAKNQIEVCKAEATFPFPKMSARLLSLKKTRGGTGELEGELLHPVFFTLETQ